MLDFSKTYVNSVAVAMHFQRDIGIRLQQAKIEELFGKLVGAPSSNLNLPDDAPPTMARIIFANAEKKTGIVLSQSAVQINFSGPEKSAPIADQLDQVRQRCVLFQKAAETFKEPALQTETTFVLEINTPDERSPEQLNVALANRFLKVPTLGPIGSAGFQVGYEIDSKYFMNISGHVFLENRFSPDQTIAVPSEPPPGEKWQAGIGVKIDVNNKLEFMRSKKFEYRGIDPLFNISEKFIKKDLPAMFSL